ncbi:alpha-amylase family glycosyl hydrolase [Nibricoccus sp. IMCC34717]|uniref:alpha-amylase family glycosyl hydrolase n=1 Tax=Nibricoccus sp. IMCC34717 TaxID=3034021 RepID=UPI00384CC0E1
MKTLPFSRPQPKWLRSATFYQIYPQSFADSNGDGIGDLRGIISKLDYLRWLGVNALWLNPIFDSPFLDAGYDVRDFRKVAPRYGTKADAEALFHEAHKRGIRVVLDLVAGHTSNEHPWFKASASGKSCRERNWYIWTDLPPGSPLPETTLCRETVASPGARPQSYLPNFLAEQPALNYGYADPSPSNNWEVSPEHPDCLALRVELREIMRFWLDLGCDGFRVDMASSLVKRDSRASALKRLWGGYREWLDREYPEAVLISEWSRPVDAIASGFHIDFLIHFHETAYTDLVGPFRKLGAKGSVPPVYCEAKGSAGSAPFVNSYQTQLEATQGGGYIALPTGNHDFNRPSFGRDDRDLRVLYALLFNLPGVPFVYYGDEIGLSHRDNLEQKEGSMWRSPCRTPMQWDKTKNFGFSSADANQLYLPVDSDPKAENVASQRANRKSLLHWTRMLLQLRRQFPALGNDGRFKVLHQKRSGKGPLCFLRIQEKDTVLVVVNPSLRPFTLTPKGVKRNALLQEIFAMDALAARTRSGVKLTVGPRSAGAWLL